MLRFQQYVNSWDPSLSEHFTNINYEFDYSPLTGELERNFIRFTPVMRDGFKQEYFSLLEHGLLQYKSSLNAMTIDPYDLALVYFSEDGRLAAIDLRSLDSSDRSIIKSQQLIPSDYFSSSKHQSSHVSYVVDEQLMDEEVDWKPHITGAVTTYESQHSTLINSI